MATDVQQGEQTPAWSRPRLVPQLTHVGAQGSGERVAPPGRAPQDQRCFHVRPGVPGSGGQDEGASLTKCPKTSTSEEHGPVCGRHALDLQAPCPHLTGGSWKQPGGPDKSPLRPPSEEE